MTAYTKILQKIQEAPCTWLVTGVAGFIGSNLLESLLLQKQRVVGLDNFMTGYQENLDLVRQAVGEELWKNFTFIEGDIRHIDTCHKACQNVDYVLHHAALGSVTLSIDDPSAANECNIDGFLNMLVAARDAKVKNFVYAASSSTYGTEPSDTKQEDRIGEPLSPYAVTKYVNELYANVFTTTYGVNNVGLRYFNIFGKRQDPKGAYAAVIPIWYAALLKGDTVYINGDGETTRDFCHVDNVVQMNILAALAPQEACNKIYNVGLGEKTTLNELYGFIRDEVVPFNSDAASKEPAYREFRIGDIRHSQANVDRAKTLLGYEPTCSVSQGLHLAAQWYASSVK